MTAKEYLQQYRQAFLHAKQIERRIDEYSREITRPKAIEYTDMPRAHDSEHDLSDQIVRLEDMHAEWWQQVYACRRIMREITRVIDAMEDPDESRILELRYITRWIDSRGCTRIGLPWAAIMERMGYVRGHVNRIHGRALLHFKIPESEKLGKDETQ